MDKKPETLEEALALIERLTADRKALSAAMCGENYEDYVVFIVRKADMPVIIDGRESVGFLRDHLPCKVDINRDGMVSKVTRGR